MVRYLVFEEGSVPDKCVVREQFRICGTPGFGDRITDEHDARWRRRCEVRVLAVVPAALRPVERAPGVRIASPLVGILSAGTCQNAHAGPGRRSGAPVRRATEARLVAAADKCCNAFAPCHRTRGLWQEMAPDASVD